MASRLEGRVTRVEQKLAPSGGNTWLRQLCEAAGETYVPEPGDELITLEDLVTLANAEWRVELEAAKGQAENIVPLRRQTTEIPSGAPGRAFGGERYSEPNPAPQRPPARPAQTVAAASERPRWPPGWVQDNDYGPPPAQTEYDVWHETRRGPGRH